MRKLSFGFNDEGKKFILCYQALVFSKAPLARNELRTHGQVLTILESIGVPANPLRTDAEAVLYKSPRGGEVILEGDEYTLLKRFLEAFIPDVHKSLSREMDVCLDWLEKATVVEKPSANITPTSPSTKLQEPHSAEDNQGNK